MWWIIRLFVFVVCFGQIGYGHDVTLTSQAQVNGFNRTSVDGTLTIEEGNIVDLDENRVRSSQSLRKKTVKKSGGERGSKEMTLKMQAIADVVINQYRPK